MKALVGPLHCKAQEPASSNVNLRGNVVAEVAE